MLVKLSVRERNFLRHDAATFLKKFSEEVYVS